MTKDRPTAGGDHSFQNNVGNIPDIYTISHCEDSRGMIFLPVYKLSQNIAFYIVVC